jgi:hypothetical protein
MASELGNQIRRDATARKHASYRKPGRDGRIKMAAADVAECRDEDKDGQPVPRRQPADHD